MNDGKKKQQKIRQSHHIHVHAVSIGPAQGGPHVICEQTPTGLLCSMCVNALQKNEAGFTSFSLYFVDFYA